MLEKLADKGEWLQFLDRKASGGRLRPSEEADLRDFIEREEFRDIAERILNGDPMPAPVLKTINKKGTTKKRTVFVFPREENYALKLLASFLHRYDGIFGANLYSFRQGTGAHRAVRRLMGTPRLREMYVYKADVHDYFNSIDVMRLLEQLREILRDAPDLYDFLKTLLEDPYAIDEGEKIRVRKGVMAGTPTAPFLANVYLMDMDRWFEENKVLYARYSDDIIVFAGSKEELDRYVERIRAFLRERGLEINPAKEDYAMPGEPWTFLGFRYQDGVLDVAPASVEKLKAKMRRKARALIRWRARKGLDGPKAARAFIRSFNRKLYENRDPEDLTWTRWYFPVINTDRSLKVIDAYMQDCIRYIAAGHHGKKRYNLRYKTMKEWGYRPLVHEYYAGTCHRYRDVTP